MKQSQLKVLVTGSSGFLGSVFLDFLERNKISYVRYDRHHPERFSDGFNAVVHFGGATPHSKKGGSISADRFFRKANGDATKELLAAIAKNPALERFINIGTFAEYGFSAKPFSERSPEHPVDGYGKSKQAQSVLVRDFSLANGVKTIHLRIANVAGTIRTDAFLPRVARTSVFQYVARLFSSNVSNPVVVPVSNEDDVRDYVDIEDVMRAVLAALVTEKGGIYEVVNICSGRGTSLKEIVRLYGKLFNRSYLLRNSSRRVTVSVGRPAKAARLLGWSPRIPLTESIRKTVGMKKRVLVIGAGVGGAMLLDALKKEHHSDIVPIGFVDDDIRKQGKSVRGLPVLGMVRDVPHIVQTERIDYVLISAPSAQKNLLQRVTELLPPGFPIKLLPSVASVILGKVDLSYVRDINPADLIGRPVMRADQRLITRKARKKTFLVTGGAGSIGSELVRQLRDAGAKRVIIFDSWEEGVFNLTEELRASSSGYVSDICGRIGNVRDRTRLEEVCKEFHIDVILHAAAYKHVPLMEENPGEAHKTNYTGTKNVLDSAIRHRIKEFVFISTDKAVHPTSVMGQSKRAAELLVKRYAAQHSNYRFSVVRFGNVLNSSGSLVPTLMRQIRSHTPVTITHRDMTRFFMSIPEAVSLVLMSWILAKNGQILVLDMGEPVRIMDLAINLIRLHGLEPYVDIPIEETGIRPGEKLHEELSYNPSRVRKSLDRRIFIAEEL